MIISISGLARSGKDTVGNILINKFSFKRVGMADALKEITAKATTLDISYFYDDNLKDKTFDVPLIFDETLAGNLAYELNQVGVDVTPSVFSNKLGEVLESPRKALVFIGTDLCRNLIDENIWLNLAIRKIKTIEGHVVITDARFKNEREAIKAENGVNMFVDRPEITQKFDPSKAHVSELDQLNGSYDIVVTNDSTLSSLAHDVEMWFNTKQRELR